MDDRIQMRSALGALFRKHKLIPAKVRFWASIEVTETGCWEWLGTRISSGPSKGYGYFYIKGINTRVIKWAYEYLIGPIPEGYERDHLCRNRGCVNPWHTEPVTHLVNVRRGLAKKTVCIRGHQLQPPNLISDGSGGTRCRECNRLKSVRLSRIRRANLKLRRQQDVSRFV